MIKSAAIFIVASLTMYAQTFQPPSWGQGRGQGQGQGAGQGQGPGQGQGSGQGQGGVQQQIEQLQQQIQRLRAQQRQQSRPHVEAQSGMVVGHPVSGKEIRHATQHLADGTVIDRGTDVSYFYRDAKGRMRAEGPNGVEIFDPVAQVEYSVNPANKTYSHSFFSGNVSFVAIAAYGNSTQSSISSGNGNASQGRSPDGITEDLGRQTVNGVPAKGSRVTITIPAGGIGNNQEIKVVNERWYSEELEVLVKSTNTDPRFGVNMYELTDIKQSPPDVSLFAPPSDYTLTGKGNGR